MKLIDLCEQNLSHNDIWGWISPENRFYEVPKLKHQGFMMRMYKDREFGWDYDRVFDAAIEDGWVRMIYEYQSHQFKGELSLNGHMEERVKSVFKSIFFDQIKYGNNSIYLEWNFPERGYVHLSTYSQESKKTLMDYIDNKVKSGSLNEIDRGEANDPLSSIQTLIDGKRNVGFISFDKSMINHIKELGIKIIPTRNHGEDLMNGVIYLDPGKKDAIKLYKIAMSHNGYLNDQSPEEAREIGELLGYTDENIKQYIWDKYHSKNTPSDDPEDYSDFH